jgi:NAD(P)-dependent dehydrogenase (short-subunit alcohol dehydrogenase family)
MAVEYGGRIRFNAVLPGAVVTALWAEAPPEYEAQTIARPLVGRLGAPEDIAAAVAFLASEDASFVTGLRVGGRANVVAAGDVACFPNL